MSGYLKKAVQKILIRRRHRLYEERIARQAVPYGVWLEKLLKQEKQEILQWKEERERAGKERLSVVALSWQEFSDCVFGGKYREKQEDLWIVTPEVSFLADEAEAEAERYFLEHPV